MSALCGYLPPRDADRATAAFCDGEPVRSGVFPSGSAAGERVLVLGLGNDILSDDAVGLTVARAVRAAVRDVATIRVVATEEMGLSLLDFIAGHRELIIVDAIQTGRAAPGTLHEIDGDALCVLPRISPHFLGVGEILTLGRQLGLAMPERVKIFAIEVADPFTLGTELTPAVATVVPEAVSRVLACARERSVATEVESV